MENNLIKVEFNQLSKIEDHNCEAIAYGSLEHKKLNELKEKLRIHDLQDGIEGNDPLITACIGSVEETILINTKQTGHDKSEQYIFDSFMTFNDVA